MRSVRSLARIGSWAQLRKDSGSQQEKEEKANEKEAKPKESSKSETERKKKSKREKGKGKEKKEKVVKEKEEAKEKLTAKMSNSEVDSLPPSAMRSPKEVTQTLGRKVSILGLGLPSSMRLPTLRGGSTASSVVTAAQSNSNRLSVESGILGRGRSGSVLSNGSSLRPVSTASSNSRVSSNSSSSVRWDEEGLETVKEQRRKERLEKAKEERRSKKRSEKDKTRDKDVGRKRAHISDIFLDAGSSTSPLSDEMTPRCSSKSQGPLLTVEEATCDHSADDDDDPTPTKTARPRPVSEQLLSKNRPVAMYDNGEGN
jgi:serine/arginine repetitive matrix protein 2